VWNDVVVHINEFVGGRARGLFSKDSISKFVVEEFRAHSRVIGGALLPAAMAGQG
jgi:hypothetical protein